MEPRISRILDDCLARINSGESVAACLADNAELRDQLDPLLNTAIRASALPKVSPSIEFRQTSRLRLLTRLKQEQQACNSAATATASAGETISGWRALWHGLSPAKRVAIVVAIVVLSVLTTVSLLPRSFNPLYPAPALASPCVLSILDGSAEFRSVTSDSWQPCRDGMVLQPSTLVRTGQHSNVILTFFDGSTIKLEPDTNIEIQKIKQNDDESADIVLRQAVGTTWTSVACGGETASHYRLETPAAVAEVQGTLFTTAVTKEGLTRFEAVEGVITVTAEGEAVRLTKNQLTEVDPGRPPSESRILPQAETELIVTSELPLVIAVLDPTGASTGFLPSGLSFNQIKDSEAARDPHGRQVISIQEPIAGEYKIILRPVTTGSAMVGLITKSEGTIISNIRRQISLKDRNGLLVHLDLVTESGSIVGSVITGLEPISDRLLEKVVATELAQERAVPFRLEASDTTNPDAATEADRSSDEATESSASGATDINSEAAEQAEAPSDTEVDEPASDEDATPDDRMENNQGRPNGRTDSTVGSPK